MAAAVRRPSPALERILRGPQGLGTVGLHYKDGSFQYVLIAADRL
ncbi:hypothetical protein [Streptomyces sp. NPDC054961]